MTTTGAQPTPPHQLLQSIIQRASNRSPGYTANLPGTLIEDIASTDVGAAALMDQARVDAINSVTPYGANAYLLKQYGEMLGIPQGQPTRTSVHVVVSGPAGYVLQQGFTVSDGSHNYSLTRGGVIASGGQSPKLEAKAAQSGSWSVPAGSVTQIVTSVPSSYSLSVNNPNPGVPGSGSQSVPDYRAQVIEAFKAPAQGVPSYLTAQLKKIGGVTPRLVAMHQVSSGWVVVCGGGDRNSVSEAIYQSVVDLSTLQGSQISSSRDVTTTLTVPPDSYNITYVAPPEQTVTGTITWNTELANFTQSAQVNQLAATALKNYVNSIPVGNSINLVEMNQAFTNAVSSVIDADNINALTYDLKVNGSNVSPPAGKRVITSDPESYFHAAANALTVQKG